MNVVSNSKGCVGCGACVSICGQNALRLEKGPEGFYNPELDAASCVDCSRCTAVCPLFVSRDRDLSDSSFYYGWSANDETREFSTSGGAFKAIADEALKLGGSVIGARYSDDWSRVESASADECGIERLQRTKYCQCYPRRLYKNIKDALKNGRFVMAVVSPCTAAALRNYFNDNDNLLIVDFFCGGVVPEKMLSDYTGHLKNKYRSDIVNMNMRDKSKSWDQPSMRVDFKSGATYLKGHRYDPYLFYYYTPYFKNEPCLDCPFTGHCCSDLTLGDFWGFRKEKIENDGKGISLICAHTALGKKFAEKLKSSMSLFPLTQDEVSYAFTEKSFSQEKRALRSRYLEELKTTDFVEIARKHEFKGGVLGAAVRKVKRKLIKS